MKQNEVLSEPFFVKFLEGSNRVNINAPNGFPWPWWPGTSPGLDKETHKAPSDDDEDTYI
jgi:hypothetical protein